MGKIIKLTESDLVKIVNKVISEQLSDKQLKNFKLFGRRVDNAWIDVIVDYVQPYLESGCVRYRYTDKYFIIDVESPSYFEEHGFDKFDGRRIKDKLRGYNFQSTGVGQYVKEIHKDV